MHRRALLAICTLVSFSNLAQAAAPTELKIATWNLEWFMKPETMRALAPACTPADAPRDGTRRSVPCDVANELGRSHEDIAALRRYAETLGADIVALQEVDGADAARLVFHDYQFCFSSRVAVQNNGFAIRRGLPISCGPELLDLSMNDDVRRGVELKVFPGTPRELRLLSVHLKSGCARDPLDSTRAGCAVLARQVPILERWIDARANEHKPFAVLGDFNRDLRREPVGAAVWPDIDDGVPPAADLVNTAEGKAFQNCMPSQTFSGFIDYIILGRQMAQGLVPDSFGRAIFQPQDAQRRKLSDHCPVFIRIRVADAVRDMP
jgi:endonuclease/exonuclease/phosphatase family metal-dependent hydrolase